MKSKYLLSSLLMFGSSFNPLNAAQDRMSVSKDVKLPEQIVKKKYRGKKLPKSKRKKK